MIIIIMRYTCDYSKDVLQSNMCGVTEFGGSNYWSNFSFANLEVFTAVWSRINEVLNHTASAICRRDNLFPSFRMTSRPLDLEGSIYLRTQPLTEISTRNISGVEVGGDKGGR